MILLLGVGRCHCGGTQINRYSHAVSLARKMKSTSQLMIDGGNLCIPNPKLNRIGRLPKVDRPI